LTICDDWALVDDGAYNRSRLVLAPPPSDPALEATKNVNAQVASPGAVLAYEVTISNKGAGDAAAVQLADPIPQGVSYLGGTLTTQGGPPATLEGDLISWQGAITAGQAVTVTYQAEVLGTENPIVNTSTVSHSSLAEPLVRSATSQVFSGYEGVYANEVTYEIPDDECVASVVASIQVLDPVVIDRLHVGVGLVHPWRGDITATLESPQGTTELLVASDAANSFDSYDLLLGDRSPKPINDGSNDNPEMPFFDRHAKPASPLALFSGEEGQGTWTLTLCDTSAFDAGRLEHWALFFNGSSLIRPAIALDLQPDSVQVAAGEPLTFTLVVTNAGDVPLSDVVVTAGACDSAPAWQGGDTNGDAKLDLEETWIYTCSIADVGTGDFVNVATANALDPNDDPVAESQDLSPVVVSTDVYRVFLPIVLTNP
jgi:uncharacterized repeat protein (TIGR01451 family)